MALQNEVVKLSPCSSIIDINNDNIFLFNSMHGTYAFLTRNDLSKLLGGFMNGMPQAKELVEKKIIALSNIMENDMENEPVIHTPSAFILPTYDCNLKCSYCFQHMSQVNRETMSEEMLNKIVAVIKDNGYHKNPIYLFGGEPLIGKNKLFIGKIFSIIKNNNWRFAIFTNGTSIQLYLDKFKEYKDFCDHIHVTIDGGEVSHNKRRGTNTYKLIKTNIENIVQCFIPVRIRVNIDSETVKTFPDLLKDYHELTEKFPLTIYCASIRESFCSETGLKTSDFVNNEIRHTLLQLKEKYNFILKNFIGIEFGKSIKQNKSIIEKRSFFCNHKLLFDTMGYVYPCISTASFPELAISRLGFKKESNNDWWEVYNGRNKHQCKACSYFYICGGGCNFEWQQKKVFRCKDFIENNIRYSIKFYLGDSIKTLK